MILIFSEHLEPSIVNLFWIVIESLHFLYHGYDIKDNGEIEIFFVSITGID